MKHHQLSTAAAIACLFAVGGASCVPRGTVPSSSPAPAAFFGAPTLGDVIRVVNENSARVQQLQTSGATLSVPGYPALQADLALDRPRRFRLRAGTALTGPELDLGSNDELIWIWVRQQSPPTVFYARHEQIESGATKDTLPISPSWLTEAIGLVQLDPAAQHEGPFQRWAGRLEIRSRSFEPTGERTRVTVIDDVHGWVLEQHVLDDAGQLLASTVMSEHVYDPATGVSLPGQVRLSIPAAELELTIRTDHYSINQLPTAPLQLWSPPEVGGAQYVDLSKVRPNPRPVTPQTSATRLPDRTSRSWLQRYQGFSEVR